MIVIHNDELNILFFMKYRAEGAEVPGNFLAALPPHFFFQAAPASDLFPGIFFSQAAPARRGQKHLDPAPALD